MLLCFSLQLFVLLLQIVRHSSAIKKKRAKPGTVKYRNLIDSAFTSLRARGFLRSQKPYTPSENVANKVLSLCHKVLGNNYEPDSLLHRKDKFAILNACFKELNHSVPNSLLHEVVCVNDIVEFYKTPVSTTTPYDDLKNRNDLPPNLHIEYNYTRFNPETDVKFKGISAFPESSTIVTGLKYKSKYKGFRAETPTSSHDKAIYKKQDPYEP